MDHALQLIGIDMTLRCVFHLSPAVSNGQTNTERAKTPSVVHAERDAAEPQVPRGRSFETWTRARGWASED